QRLIAARGNRARAGSEDLAAFEQRLDARMMLELLERLERLEARIAIVQADEVAGVNAILVEVIEKAAAVGAAVERPAERVLDAAGLRAPGRQLPELLEAQAECRGILALAQVELRDELLGERAARAFSKNGRARVDLDSRRVVRARRAILVQAHVADAHALDRALLVEHRLRSRKAREDIDAEFLRLLRQPRRELPERDDEVAMVVHGRKPDRPVRQLERAGLRHQP